VWVDVPIATYGVLGKGTVLVLGGTLGGTGLITGPLSLNSGVLAPGDNGAAGHVTAAQCFREGDDVRL